MPCHFTAAFAAGFCTTVVASPVDVVKTRFMNSSSGQYSGAINCALTMLKTEGPTAFYKGYAVGKRCSECVWRCHKPMPLLFSFSDSWHRFFVWAPGTLWCLWATNKSKELWYDFSSAENLCSVRRGSVTQQQTTTGLDRLLFSNHTWFLLKKCLWLHWCWTFQYRYCI